MEWDRRKITNLLPKQGEWFRIVNTVDLAEVYIFDEISFFGLTADDFVREINDITTPKLNVHINSKGGDVFDGIAIYNALRSHPAEVTVRVDSLAASIASVIAQAGDHRVMVSHSQMMIHDAYAPAIGNSEDFRTFADLLDKQSDLIASIYAESAGDKRRKSTFRNLMKAETWLSDKEAVELGLADTVEAPSKKAPAPQDSTPALINDAGVEPDIDWVKVFEEAHDNAGVFV